MDSHSSILVNLNLKKQGVLSFITNPFIKPTQYEQYCDKILLLTLQNNKYILNTVPLHIILYFHYEFSFYF